MINVYYTSEKLETYNSLQETNIYEKIQKKSWIHLINPSDEEVLKIRDITGIPEEAIRTTLDEEETAHIDIDEAITLIVVDIPVVEEEDNYPEIRRYTTTPFGIIYNNDYIVTTCLKNTTIEQGLTSRWMKNFATNKHIRLTMQLLYHNASRFVNILKQLDNDSDFVQKKLHESMKNKELFELMSLGKSLVFLSTGINSDSIVLEKIQRLEHFKQYKDDLSLIEDAIIENRQAMEMCNIHRDILNGTMDAFASVISNNVNTVMKTLTNVTIILTIPTLVASFFGMNVDLPIKENGFLIVFVLSIVLSVIGAIFLTKYTSQIRNNRRK
jgi:magnesium transporter